MCFAQSLALHCLFTAVDAQAALAARLLARRLSRAMGDRTTLAAALAGRGVVRAVLAAYSHSAPAAPIVPASPRHDRKARAGGQGEICLDVETVCVVHLERDPALAKIALFVTVVRVAATRTRLSLLDLVQVPGRRGASASASASSAVVSSVSSVVCHLVLFLSPKVDPLAATATTARPLHTHSQ